MKIIGKRPVEPNLADRNKINTSRIRPGKEAFQLIQQRLGGFHIHRFELGTGNRECSRTNVKSEADMPLQLRFEWNGPNSGEWIEQGSSGFGQQSTGQTVSQRRF